MRKAAAVARNDGLSIEWQPLTRLDVADRGRIHDLSARALQPNVFYEPEYLLAARSLSLAKGAGVLLVSSGGRLIGALAGRIEGLTRGRPVPIFVAWELPYAPLSVPLVDREMADAAVDAFLNEVPHLPGSPRVALFRLMDRGGPFASVLTDRLYSRVKQPHALDPHRRAALIPSEADPLKGVSQKRLKELRRQRARLSKHGALVRETVTGEGIEAAVEAYLKLEASGWKGRIGAAAKVSGAGSFLAEAVTGLACEGKVRIDFLKLDGRPIAATILLFSGDRAWFWKTAYDENYARFSPGVLLALELTEALGRDRSIALVDSCAVADHPMIDHLWRGRIEVADWIVPLADARSAVLALAAEKFRRIALKPVKSLRDRLRG